MCLSTVYYGKKKKAELAKLPDIVPCWKAVRLSADTNKYYPPIYDYGKPYKFGWNEVRPISMCAGYWVAYHAFLSRKEAIRWKNSNQIAVKCKTEKKDIVAIGIQPGGLSVIVTKRFWMPKPKKKKV